MNRREAGALAFALLSAAALAVTGLDWGLPSRARAERVLPPGALGPALAEHLESSWQRLHARLGENLMLNPGSYWSVEGVSDSAPGWSLPPEPLAHGVRSFLLRTMHDDEQSLFLALSRMRPRRLDFNPHFFTYGGAYLYPLGAWLAAGAAARLVPLHASVRPYLEEPGKMGRMYLWGRLLSAFAALACAALLVELGRRCFTPAAGAAAAAVLAAAPAFVIQAHTMKPAMLVAFFGLAAFGLSLRALEGGSRASFALAGACCGLAAGALLSAAQTTLFPAVAAVLLAFERPERRRDAALGLACAAAACAAAFLLTNPYWILDRARASAEIASMGGAGLRALNPPRLLWGPLREGLTWPVWLLALAGAGLSLRHGAPPARRLLSGCFIAALLFSAAFWPPEGARYIRHFLPMAALAALLAGTAVSDALASPRRRAWAALLGAVFANLALEGALYARNFSLAAGGGATLARAGDWIDRELPGGATVGLLRLPAPSHTPHFAFARYRLRIVPREAFLALPREALPETLVLALPDYDDRPALEPRLSREYRLAARFARPRLLWKTVHPTATTANPEVEIYRLQ